MIFQNIRHTAKTVNAAITKLQQTHYVKPILDILNRKMIIKLLIDSKVMAI